LNKIKISVLMPVFNEEKYINDALISLVNQANGIDYTCEIIVIDDFSTDRTVEIVSAFLRDYCFIKFYKNVHKGKVAGFNLAFRRSSGDLICLFAGDDMLPADSLRMRASPLKDHINEKYISLCKSQSFSEDRRFDGLVIPKGSRGNWSGGCMMMTRALASDIFPLPENLENEDIWISFFLKFITGGKIINVPRVGLYYRIHGGNSSKVNSTFQVKNESMHKRRLSYKYFYDKYKDIIDREKLEELEQLIIAEDLRYKGDVIGILRLKKIGYYDKIKDVVFSNKVLYEMRRIMFKNLSGW